MDDLFILIGGILFFIFLGIAIIFVVSFLTTYTDINYSQSNIIKIYLKEDKIYEGKSAFAAVYPTGDTTKVIIYTKLFPISKIDKVYVDKNIKVVN